MNVLNTTEETAVSADLIQKMIIECNTMITLFTGQSVLTSGGSKEAFP